MKQAFLRKILKYVEKRLSLPHKRNQFYAMQKYLFISLCLLFTLACNPQKDELLQTMEGIKELGNVDPEFALERLDSLSTFIEDQSDYLRSKYRLLEVRLHDKADHIPVSDKAIKRLIKYFDDHGKDLEKQEAYYYAGSVYRDLQDIPHALEFFLKSMYIAEKSDVRDSLMLRNTFSNLSYLFNGVNDNPNYLLYAKKECVLSAELGLLTDTSIQHLADAYTRADSLEQAMENYDLLFLQQKKEPNREMLFLLLYSYSFLERLDKASECKLLVDSIAGTELSALNTQEIKRLGRFYWLTNNFDKAKECYDSILVMDGALIDQYDAARYLIGICNWIGEREQASKYAIRFVQLCDTLNLSHNQQMAATVNNLYKYQRDKEEEHKVYEESQRNQRLSIGSTVSFILLFFVGIILNERKKRKHLQRVLSITGELEKSKEEQQKLLLEINRLSQQNETYTRLLLQADLHNASEDVFHKMQQASKGLHQMNPNDWRQFYHVVDEQDPKFIEDVRDNLGTFTEQQMQFCYLLRMGFSKQQIQNITNLSRITVWRWEKKYDWVLRE